MSLTNLTPSISRAGNVFQYMVTGTTIGELKSSSRQVLVTATAAGLFEAALGDSVTRELGVSGTYEEGVPCGVLCVLLGGVAAKSLSKSRLIFLSDERRSASVKSNEILLVWLC